VPRADETFDHILAETRDDWRAWLAANHATAPGVWLVTYKKGSGQPHLPWSDVVDEALCFGWIDSRGNKVDAARTKLLVTPRKPGSGWSRINKEKIERLHAAGLITPAGQAKIDAAKADGSWTLLDDVEALVLPPDLAAALAADPAAAAGWDAFPPSAKKPLLWWLASAKRPDTRAKRLAGVLNGAKEGRNPLAYAPKRPT
jgi:uncharacterized protein YdeI (YjbR/CyaY-like superfamily)